MKNEFLNAESLKNDWDNNPRWKGITRNYSAEDVVSIRNSVDIKHTLAENGAQKLFENLNKKDCLLYTSPSPRDGRISRMPSSA